MAQEECEVEHQAGEHSLVWDRNLLTTFAVHANLREHQVGEHSLVWDRESTDDLRGTRKSA